MVHATGVFLFGEIMANAKRDANYIPAILATSNADGTTTLPVYVDSSTNRLLVSAIITSGGSAGTQYDDGDADATPTGTVAMGTDGSNVYAVATDTDGHLQVDVLSGGGGGTQYTEGDTDASITGTALLFEGAADTLIAAPGTAANGLDVDVTRVSGTVTVDGSGVTQPISHTALTELAAAIDTEVQVDIVGSLPAGTNNIGDVDIASIAAGDNNIGNVDIASIAAGDNNIGNVDLASAIPAGTNNIGDVDVLTVPRSLSGPGQPGTAIDSYTHASFNLAAGADQVLVASAASKQIWVYGIGFTVNVAGTVSFQDQDDLAITGVMNIAAAGGMVVAPSGNFAMPIWKLGTDKDLEVDVVTSELDGWIDYAILSV